MKSIYISLPITWQESNYDERMNAALEYIKEKYTEYELIVTPKELAEDLDENWWGHGKPKYRDYLAGDIVAIKHCDAIFLCKCWEHSKGCRAEYAFADAIGLTIFYQPL